MPDTQAMQVIAHRGGAALRIENTLAAFANAIDIGADGAELDVRLTRDGQVVVHHDDALDAGYCRDDNGAWIDAANRPRIAELTYAELQRYDIGVPCPGSNYARQHTCIEAVPGQRIPLLRDVVRLVKARSPHFRLVVEIKTPIEEAARQPWRRLLDATLATLRKEEFLERAILCSFDWGALVAAKQKHPALPTWFTTAPLSWFESDQPLPEDDPPIPEYLQTLRVLYGSGAAPWYSGHNPRALPGGYPEAIAAAGGDAWFIFDRDCTAERVRAASEFGLLTATWSTRDAGTSERERLQGIDIAAMCLDDVAPAITPARTPPARNTLHGGR